MYEATNSDAIVKYDFTTHIQKVELETNALIEKIKTGISNAESKSLVALESSKMIIISDAEIYAEACGDVKTIKTESSTLEDVRKEITKPVNAFLKSVNSIFKSPADNYDQAEKNLKEACARYDEEQEKIRIAEQERVKKEQEKAAAELAEKARKAEEAAQKERDDAEKLRLEAEKLKESGNEEEAKKLEIQADKKDIKAEAKLEKAETLTQQSIETEYYVPVVAKSTPKISGTSYMTVYDVEIVNIDLIPDTYIIKTVNEKALKSLATTTEGKAKVPGVVFNSRKVMRSSGRK